MISSANLPWSTPPDTSREPNKRCTLTANFSHQEYNKQDQMREKFAADKFQRGEEYAENVRQLESKHETMLAEVCTHFHNTLRLAQADEYCSCS